MSQALNEARHYEEETELQIDETERPAFHLSPRIGWMNDPNGFSFYGGKYHLFYQYYPYSSHWGPMHWGHAVSDDMIRWTYLPAALAPDEPYDRDGCFSGSAVTMRDGKQLLMYTGAVSEKEFGGAFVQTQNLAVGDGLEYVKYKGNPVITAADLPKGGSPYDFRDPKMWREEDGSYGVVIACRNEGGYTQVVLFRSEDGLRWDFDTVLAENHDRIGRMWECPDFFRLDGKYVLLVSAMDMLPSGMEYHSGNNCVYFVGEYDRETGIFTEECDHAADYGIDFYAAQTTLTPDGRRVMIGWMQNPDTTSLRTLTHPVFGQMSIPRELSVRDGVLYQTPVRELSAYRTDPVVRENVRLDDADLSIHGISGRLVDLEVEIRAQDPVEGYREFRCRFACGERFYTEFCFRPKDSVISIDRKFSGQRRAIIRHREAGIRHENGRLCFRMILDRYSAEVFVNGGEKVMTVTLETPREAEGISFHVKGKAILNIKKYRLEI